MPRRKSKLTPEQVAARKAARRRERYRTDPEFRERVRAANRRHAARRQAVQPDPVKTFDDLLATYEEKWAREEAK